jgi:D-inositol-3-phosphate glycosyltransferase
MRITLIGPAYPWRGGIPLFTSELAHRLARDGQHVRLRTWCRQGPVRFVPAQRHPLAEPESPVYPTVAEPLSWRNPVHWWRTGRRAGGESDAVVLTFYTSFQAPALYAIARLAGRRARVVLVCHNVVPHEARPGDRWLLSLLAGAAHAVLVHTRAEGDALAELTGRRAAVAALPPHLPVGSRRASDDRPRGRLLFFGKVRQYKGVDVLLRALARLEDVRLSIVGEFYQSPSELRALAAELGLTERVSIHPEYLPAERIPELFATADALVLPYRKATASQFVALAHWHRLPVVATRVGNFPDMLRDGVNGLLCEPDDVEDLARALRELYQPGRLAALRSAIHPADTEAAWSRYLDTLVGRGTSTVQRNPVGHEPRRV